jgi:asparagine synthase (glutamine-hydrolysing)
MRTISHLHLTRLARALLDREDRLSSAAGVEVRDPFSDHRLVEYVYNIPWSMKAIDGREKGLLRRAIKDLLPQSVAQRVKSHYPSIQGAEYVAKLQEQARDVLSESGNPVFHIVDPAWVRTAVDRDLNAITSSMRTGLERVLDFYHWFDIYRPELRLS